MLKFINPYVLLAVVLGVVGAFLYGMNVGGDRAEAKAAKAALTLQEVTDAAQKGAAREIAKIKVVNQTHRQVLEREIVNVPTGTCVLSPAGVREINAILQGGAVPAGDRELPGTDPAP